MGERIGENKAPETLSQSNKASDIQENGPESERDLQIKEAFLSIIPELKPIIDEDIASLHKVIQELQEREMSFGNFVSPENMLGLSTLVRGDGNTFSGDRLDTVRDVHELAMLRRQGLSKMEHLIKIKTRLEAIQKDGNVRLFLQSPEGKLLQDTIMSGKDSKMVEAEYYLAKAREFRDKIIRGDELAQSWYDKLDGTPLQSIGEQEKMDLTDRGLRKGREFANSMLGLDSLTMLVLGAGFGRDYSGNVGQNPSRESGQNRTSQARSKKILRTGVRVRNIAYSGDFTRSESRGYF